MSEVLPSPPILRTNIARILTSLGKIDSAGEVADALMEELRGTYDSIVYEDILLEELERGGYTGTEMAAIIQQMRDREQIRQLLSIMRGKTSHIMENTETHRGEKSPEKELLPDSGRKQVTRLIPRPQKI